MSEDENFLLLIEPLLESHESTVPPRETACAPQRPGRRFYVLIFLLKAALSLFSYIPELPLVRLVEAAICQRHYGIYSSSLNLWAEVGEDACKLAVIQNKLAHVMGYKLAFDAIPGLLTSVIYGFLSDRYGRRPILVLACIGEALGLIWVLLLCSIKSSVPIELIWIGGLFNFIGGGPRLVYAMFFTIVADAVPATERTFVLFLLHATAQWCRMFSPLIAAALMKHDIWPPFILAICAMLASLIVAVALSETSFQKQKSLSMELSRDTTFQTIRKQLTTMFKHSGLCLIFAAFVLKRIAYTSESFIYQFASERLNLELRRTAAVNFSNYIGSTFVTSILLPGISYHWSLRGAQGPSRDLWVCRFSVLVGDIGFAMVWKSYSLLMMCFGMGICGLAEGLEAALQSVGVGIVGQDLYAGFFTFISVLDTIALFIGGPIMSALFIIRDADGLPAGYCYIFSLILFFVIFLGSWGIKTYPIVSK